MCCPLKSTFSPSVCINNQQVGLDGTTTINATINFKPITYTDRVVYTLQRLEIAEKFAEVVDESFHLLSSTLKSLASIEIYEYLKNLHQGAHHLEHGLHAFCFVSDLVSIKNKTFFEKRHDKMTSLRNVARVCQAVSHFFASIRFLSDLKIIQLGRLNVFVGYYQLISSIGFTLSTIAIVWRRSKENYYSDLAINGGGAIFEGLNFIGSCRLPSTLYPYIYKIGALAGIIHALNVINRLNPTTHKVNIKLPALVTTFSEAEPGGSLEYERRDVADDKLLHDKHRGHHREELEAAKEVCPGEERDDHHDHDHPHSS